MPLLGFASSQQATLALFIPLYSWYISAIEREAHFSLDNTSSLLLPKVHMKFAMLHKTVCNLSIQMQRASLHGIAFYILLPLQSHSFPCLFKHPYYWDDPITQGHSWYIMDTLKNKNIYCSINCPRNFS